MNTSAKKLGYFIPAEWQKHEASFLAWPHDQITFEKKRLEKVEDVYCSIIEKLHQKEKVKLLVLDKNMQKKVIDKLQKRKNIDFSKIDFFLVDYADVWIRDYGPTYLLNVDKIKRSFVKWRYNAYGNKFADLLKDDKVVYAMKDFLQENFFTANFVMEGGAIDVNGKGILLTTEQCLLNPNRNPNLDKKMTETFLKEYLGVFQIIWLPMGIANDHTDGHIDEIARFVNDNTIAIGYEDDKKDINFEILHTNFKILQKAKNIEGKSFEIKKNPMPKMLYDNGERAPASYLNFYIANNLVLVPQFHDKNDKKALKIIQELFPSYEVFGIDSSDLIYGGGSIHCITQQQPLL